MILRPCSFATGKNGRDAYCQQYVFPGLLVTDNSDTPRIQTKNKSFHTQQTDQGNNEKSQRVHCTGTGTPNQGPVHIIGVPQLHEHIDPLVVLHSISFNSINYINMSKTSNNAT